MLTSCPVCHGDRTEVVFETHPAPTAFVLPRDAAVDSGRFETLRLAHCATCGHLFNQAFDDAFNATLYGAVPLSNKPADPSMITRFADLVDWLGDDLLNGAEVLEIGSGTGHAARAMAQRAARVHVIEPCEDLVPEMLPEANVGLSTASFPLEGFDELFDLVVCRQVLEHVSDPWAFLSALRDRVRDGGHAFVEVPNAAFVVEHALPQDIHFQHVQYFTPEILTRLAEAVGLRPVRRLDIKDGHDVGILFEKTAPGGDFRPEGSLDVASARDLGRRLEARREAARARLKTIEGPVLLYGATIHGQAFLNFADQPGRFDGVLDDAPECLGYGLFDRGGVVPALSPAELDATAVETVVIAAYLHDRVIAEKLRARGFAGTILSIGPETGGGDFEILWNPA